MAQQDPKSVALVQFVKSDLESITPYIQRLLPWKGGVERFVQMTELAIRRNFNLLSCNRNSFLLSLLWCAQKNLEPGVDDGCWLIPYKETVTPVPAYKGLIKVAVETGTVLDVQPYPIFAADTFEYTLGLAPTLTHIPAKFGSDRGELIGAYVIFTMPDGSKRFAPPMDRPSIEKVRGSSAAYRSNSKSGPWVEWEEAMFLKTAIKQGFKYIPVKAALRDLIYDDNQLEAGTKISLLLQQSGTELPELEEETPPAQASGDKGKSEPVDFSTLKSWSKFDALAGPEIQDLSEEEQGSRVQHLRTYLENNAAAVINQHKFTPLKAKEEVLKHFIAGFETIWQKFLDWEARPEHPWNQGQESATEPGAEGGPAEKAEAEAAAGDPEGPGTEEETFEARAHRVWGLVVKKYGSTKDMKANVGIARSAEITPDNIAEIEAKVT